MVSPIQKATAEAIVNIFETGSALGDYGNVTLLPNDSGHLTYGRSQTTLASGNLFLLLKAYVAADGAVHAADFAPYLPRVQARDLLLDTDSAFRTLLRDAGADPVMCEVQDTFFDRVYWAPAAAAAQQLGITKGLGCCVVYDSIVHGSWSLVRDKTIAQVGQPGGQETAWITSYVAVRRNWLVTYPNPLLHKTVYRMDAFQQIIAAANWDLALPLLVRGVTIDATVLSGQPVRVSAQVVEERLLMLAQPMMQGNDVADLQRALAGQGSLDLQADGVFGEATQAAVMAFQRSKGLTADGIVGPATRATLGI